jgi:hypothetical protein
MHNFGITLAGVGVFIYLVIEAGLALYDTVQYAGMYQ